MNSRKKCHNCGCVEHIACNCWEPGGGAEGQGPNHGRPNGGIQQGDAFPTVNNAGIRNPPRTIDPRGRTFPNGQVVKWCGLCGFWTDHYRVGHTGGEE